MKKKNTSIFIIFIVVILVLGMGGYVLFHKTASPAASYKGIAGSFDLNGVIPSGSTITLFAKDIRKQNAVFVPFASNISPRDQEFWQYPAAHTGASYEIQAGLVQNGSVIYLTSPVSVTAPAINQVLTFNVPAKEPAGSATISGNVGIDGYIPPGATLSLQGRKTGTQTFTVVVSNIAAKDEQSITYTTAVAGQTYEVQALLYDAQGALLGSSPLLMVAAPAFNEELNVNSTAVPPVTPTAIPTATPLPPATPVIEQVTVIVTPVPTTTPLPTQPPVVSGNISGVVRFNGQAPSNSRMVIFERLTGTQNYQVAIDNLAPQDGTTWQWNNGVAGTMYDMIAILKQRQNNGTDTDISSSNTLTLDAPAANEVFTINSGFLLPSPSGSVSINCGSYNSNSQTWMAGLSFPTVNGAQSYWYQVGTTNGGLDLTNFTQNATNNSLQSFTVQLRNGVTYYARYAYGNVPNLMGNDPQFSSFSSTTPLRCAQ